MPKKLQQAVTAIKAGKRRAAYQLLTEIIRSDPKSKEAENAWILMSAIVKDPNQKRQSLDAALLLNPDNIEAQRQLKNLNEKLLATGTDSKQTTSKTQILNSEKNSTKTCPYCAETIKTDAIFCRYCNHDLTNGTAQSQNPSNFPTDKGISASKSNVGKDIKDVGKTTAGVAFGILSAPVVLTAIVIIACCVGCLLVTLPSRLTSKPTSSPTISTLPATYTPQGSSPSSVSGGIPITRMEMMRYFERNHSFGWRERARHTDGTYHWSGWETVDGPKLVLWSESSDEENLKELSYSFAFGGDNSESEIHNGNAGLFDTLVLVLPNWDSGEDWITNSYQENLDSDRTEFQTKVSGLTIYLDMGSEEATGDFIIILSISE